MSWFILLAAGGVCLRLILAAEVVPDNKKTLQGAEILWLSD